jgi:hypothetical protein
MVEVPGLVCIISLVVERVVEVPGFIVGFVGLVGLVGLTGLTGLVVERIVGLTARVGGDRVRPLLAPPLGVLRRRRLGLPCLAVQQRSGQLLLRAQRCWRLRRRSALLVMPAGSYTHPDRQRAPRSRCRRRDEVRAGLPG